MTQEMIGHERIAVDRRVDRRYDIRLDLRWKLIHRRRVLGTGTGRTADMSSGGVLFEAGGPLPTGVNVELYIAWPALLYDQKPLQLVVFGKILRAEGNGAAIRVLRHEFRTRDIS